MKLVENFRYDENKMCKMNEIAVSIYFIELICWKIEIETGDSFEYRFESS